MATRALARRAMVLVGTGGLLALGSCGPAPHAPHGKIGVLAAESSWGDIAGQIGAGRVAVTSMINDSGADPHEYETSVRDAASLAGSTVVIQNGLGYDGFVDKLLSADPDRGRTVLTVADIAGVHGHGANPHLWYSPQYVMAAARAFEAALAKVTPADARLFEANLRSFLIGEQRVVDVLDRIKEKHGGARVAYAERVPGYLLQAAGLRLGSPASFAQSIEDGHDPSPADNVAFERALTARTVKVLILNADVSDPATRHLRQVAIDSAIPVLVMTENLPTSEPDFQTWQADQARALLAALGG